MEGLSFPSSTEQDFRFFRDDGDDEDDEGAMSDVVRSKGGTIFVSRASTRSSSVYNEPRHDTNATSIGVNLFCATHFFLFPPVSTVQYSRQYCTLPVFIILVRDHTF